MGQLDGGHILYSLTGPGHRRLALVLWLALLLLGLAWPGWALWCLVIFVLGLRHPPVADELRPLGRARQAIAAVVLLIFLLSFAPVPLATVAVGS